MATWVLQCDWKKPAAVLLGWILLAPVACAQQDSGTANHSQEPAAKTQTTKPADSAAKTNPYLPRPGLSVEELRAYIDRMQEAPLTIRNRPGFPEGIALAAQRILDSDPQGSLRTYAVLQLLNALHQAADLDEDREADTKLSDLAVKYADDKDQKIASAAAFYVLEQRVLKADGLDTEKLPGLLDEVKASLTGRPLGAEHLRIASGTVHAINRLKDDADATKRTKEFGELFAASSNPLLSSYGRKMLRTAGGEEQSPWVGKPMELAGTTAEGGKFDIAHYQGKVVIVDFWATWCGPCVASLPDLKEIYEKYHDQGLEIVGVSLDSEPDKLSDFLDKNKLPWANVVGEQKDGQMQFPLAEKYGVSGIPTTFIIGKDGKILSQSIGVQNHDDLLRQVLLAMKADVAKPPENSNLTPDNSTK